MFLAAAHHGPNGAVQIRIKPCSLARTCPFSAAWVCDYYEVDKLTKHDCVQCKTPLSPFIWFDIQYGPLMVVATIEERVQLVSIREYQALSVISGIYGYAAKLATISFVPFMMTRISARWEQTTTNGDSHICPSWAGETNNLPGVCIRALRAGPESWLDAGQRGIVKAVYHMRSGDDESSGLEKILTDAGGCGLRSSTRPLPQGDGTPIRAPKP